MARASHQAIRGHPNRGHPRSILSRQRCRMDPGTGSRPWNSMARQLLVVARAEADPIAAGRENGNAAPEDPRAGTGMDSHVAERPARKGKGAPQFLRNLA